MSEDVIQQYFDLNAEKKPLNARLKQINKELSKIRPLVVGVLKESNEKIKNKENDYVLSLKRKRHRAPTTAIWKCSVYEKLSEQFPDKDEDWLKDMVDSIVEYAFKEASRIKTNGYSLSYCKSLFVKRRKIAQNVSINNIA